MEPVAQVVTVVLAVVGAVTSGVALWVQRRNAHEAAVAAQTASVAKTKADEQSLAHTELVDALGAMGEMVDRYRQQVDDTRQQLGRYEKQMVTMQSELTVAKEEHRQCRHELEMQARQLRVAEARIAGLGG